MRRNLNLKELFLVLCKWLGFFHLSRWITRKRLRILCYHAFELADEVSFRPRLFMRGATFEARLRFLRDQAFPVLPLGEAVDRLKDGTLPSSAVVLTIDDGFYSVRNVAVPIIERYQMPATLYLTSYYAGKQNPIFSLAVQYLFWKSPLTAADLSSLSVPGLAQVNLLDPVAKGDAMETVIRHGVTNCDEPQRCVVARTLGAHLNVSYDDLVHSKVLTVLSGEELRHLSGAIDVQLHTHRHRFPEDENVARQEIQENRDFLRGVVAGPLRHFCYPSGVWSQRMWPWLADLGIETATTCEPGSNGRSTPRLALRRFLDSEELSQIQFESELSGFSELLRYCRNMVRD